MRPSWCALWHRNPWRHKRCASCTLARRAFAADDLLGRRGWPPGAARDAAAANLATLGPNVLNLDEQRRRPR